MRGVCFAHSAPKLLIIVQREIPSSFLKRRFEQNREQRPVALTLARARSGQVRWLDRTAPFDHEGRGWKAREPYTPHYMFRKLSGTEGDLKPLPAASGLCAAAL